MGGGDGAAGQRGGWLVAAGAGSALAGAPQRAEERTHSTGRMVAVFSLSRATDRGVGRRHRCLSATTHGRLRAVVLWGAGGRDFRFPPEEGDGGLVDVLRQGGGGEEVQGHHVVIG